MMSNCRCRCWMARADKAWGRLVDDTLYRGNIDVGAVTDRRAPLRWSASAKRLVHGERHARICDGIGRHMDHDLRGAAHSIDFDITHPNAPAVKREAEEDWGR